MGNSDVPAARSYSLVCCLLYTCSLLFPSLLLFFALIHIVSLVLFGTMSCLELMSNLTPSSIMSEDEVWSCASLPPAVSMCVADDQLEMQRRVLEMPKKKTTKQKNKKTKSNPGLTL